MAEKEIRIRLARTEDMDTLRLIFSDRSTAEEAYNGVLREEEILFMQEKGELFLVSYDEESVGILSLGHTEASDIRNLGYRLLPVYRGQGIGAKMVKEGLKFAREALGIRWLYAYVAEGNLPSCRILEALDFQKKLSAPGFLENGAGECILTEFLTYTKRLVEEVY